MMEPVAVSACEHCGRELGANDPAPLCASCELLAAEAALTGADTPATPIDADRRTAPDPARARVRRVVAIAAALIALAALAVEVPLGMRALAAPAPRRQGSVATDAATDRCIGNLWQVLGAVTEGRTYSGAPVCPVTGAPYVVTKEDGVTVVSCPNPGRHGLTEITIRSDTILATVR